MNRLIIFPTDTVYGIGCSIYDTENQEKIFKIKRRPKNRPLAVLCASMEQIKKIAYVSDDASKLIAEFLPGPLTLILPAKEEIKELLGQSTIGVRIPNSTIALQILSEMGPMTTTSVNESGSVPLNEYETICKAYVDCVDYIYEPAGQSSNIASTVVTTIPCIKMIREGAISLEQINEILNK